MAKRKSNNAKRANWKKNLVWTIVTFVIMGVLFMAVERKKNATITKVGISIKGIKGGKNLVTKKGVKTMFRNYLGDDLQSSSIQDLDLMDMEMMLEADDRIARIKRATTWIVMVSKFQLTRVRLLECQLLQVLSMSMILSFWRIRRTHYKMYSL